MSVPNEVRDGRCRFFIRPMPGEAFIAGKTYGGVSRLTLQRWQVQVFVSLFQAKKKPSAWEGFDAGIRRLSGASQRSDSVAI